MSCRRAKKLVLLNLIGNFYMKKFILIAAIAMIGMMAISSQEASAKPQVTGTHNYLGTDGKWHYVTTYKDNDSGSEWSSEYRDGYGPIIHHPKKLPHWGITGGGSNGGSGNISIEAPFDVACEFSALTSGIIEIKVEEDVEVEIIKIENGSIFLPRRPVQGQSSFQSISVPAGFYTYKPYGLVLYKNNIPVYMELFFFDGSMHNSMELYSSPGYEPEEPPANN